MSGSSFGKIFKITSWGESHGEAIGVVVDGCPAGLDIIEEDIQLELSRRAPGQSGITTPRRERDKVKILSGVFENKSTGTPISMMVWNKNIKSEDYKELSKVFRPSHADYTYHKKYGIRDPLGGGRSSARITAGHVAAGAIAKNILKNFANIEIIAYVKKLNKIEIDIDPQDINFKDVEKNDVRCPDQKAADEMEKIILDAMDKGDSVGGIIECIIKNVPAGLGEPVFDKIDAELAKAIMSINAVKGFELGSGFKCAEMYGHEHNDPFEIKEGKVVTTTNNAGGIVGGITNGMPIIFRAAFKPTSTINYRQKTIDILGNEIELEASGRHDPCVIPRAVPIVEAMAAIVICDNFLTNFSSKMK